MDSLPPMNSLQLVNNPQLMHSRLLSLTLTLTLLGLLLLSPLTLAESETFGDFEVHYSVVNSTFIDPAIASHYQIVRGKDRAFINLAVRKTLPDGSDTATSAQLEGRTWDLFQNQFLEFREIREGSAIYYIADFEFSDGELRFFTINLLPEGAERSKQLKFQHKVYVN
jgi:hypothetical protein